MTIDYFLIYNKEEASRFYKRENNFITSATQSVAIDMAVELDRLMTIKPDTFQVVLTN